MALQKGIKCLEFIIHIIAKSTEMNFAPGFNINVKNLRIAKMWYNYLHLALPFLVLPLDEGFVKQYGISLKINTRESKVFKVLRILISTS